MYFNEYFNKCQKTYSALEGDETDEDYLSNVVEAAMDDITAMDDIDNGIKIMEKSKNNLHSECYREEGNVAYKDGLLQKALVLYNKALAHAPDKSLSLKLAYSNRSAVLFSAKKFKACEKDCVTALATNCVTPSYITDKLEKRLLQAKENQAFENVIPYAQEVKTNFRNFADEYFQLRSRNNDIPCASDDIEVVFEAGIPKVIAKRDIPVGTLVAIEKAFVSFPDPNYEYLSCYYCRKLDLNLFPCTGCVVALFCSKKCEEVCMKEYHLIECELIRFIHCISTVKRWVVSATIKLRNMCSSWEEFISITYKEFNGDDKLKINEIYDSSKPSSLLSFKNDVRHFLHGEVFNSSLKCGLLLKVVQTMHSFLPKNLEDRQLALKAMARIMMHCYFNCRVTDLHLITNKMNSICFLQQQQYGVFTFIGKLKHSCLSNLQLVAVNNSMAAIALEKIETGSELTVSYIMHWTDMDLSIDSRLVCHVRRSLVYSRLYKICSCVVCTKTPEERVKLDKGKVSATQEQAARDLITLEKCVSFGIPPKKCLEQIYKTLALLNNVKFSDEYKKVYNTLNRFQMFILEKKLENNILSHDY